MKDWKHEKQPRNATCFSIDDSTAVPIRHQTQVISTLEEIEKNIDSESKRETAAFTQFKVEKHRQLHLWKTGIDSSHEDLEDCKILPWKSSKIDISLSTVCSLLKWPYSLNDQVDLTSCLTSNPRVKGFKDSDFRRRCIFLSISLRGVHLLW